MYLHTFIKIMLNTAHTVLTFVSKTGIGTRVDNNRFGGIRPEAIVVGLKICPIAYFICLFYSIIYHIIYYYIILLLYIHFHSFNFCIRYHYPNRPSYNRQIVSNISFWFTERTDVRRNENWSCTRLRATNQNTVTCCSARRRRGCAQCVRLIQYFDLR